MSTKFFLAIIHTLLIVLFLYAAMTKLLDYPNFIARLHHDPLVGNFAFLVSILMPLVEIITAVMLAFSRTQKAGLWASLIIMIAFTVYVSLILTVSPRIPCVCGGFISSLSWPNHLIFNLTFVAISLTGILLNRKVNRRDPTFISRLLEST